MTRALLALLVALLAAPALAGPLETALAATAAEEKAPLERMRLFIDRGGVIDVYYIDRLRPNRTHILRNPGQNGLEAIVIGDVQWTRDGQNWTRASVTQLPANLAPSIAALLNHGLTDATETADAGGGRLIEGAISWVNGARCDGRLRLRIDKGGLPATLGFEGACADKPARFLEAFSFVGPLKIDPPD